MQLLTLKASKLNTLEQIAASMGGKKIKGRKPHIGVDSMGNLLQIFVHAANIHDTISGTCMFDLIKEKYPSVKAFSADAGYRGTSVKYVEDCLGLKLHISTKIIDGFAVLPKQWIVERTLAWTTYSRRLSKDFEVNPVYSENMVRISLLKMTASACVGKS